MNAAILLKLTVVWISCSELVAVNVLQYEDSISGQITSPGYPGYYPTNANYTWIIRTGDRFANVTFRIIEMNIEIWKCDDYLEITEIEPRYYRLFKQCGHLKNRNISGRGEKIRISFISDESMTEKGFNLTWRVDLPSTKTLHETRVTTQKILSKTTKNRIKTISKERDAKTTVLQHMTTTTISSLVYPPPTKVSPEVHITLQTIILSTTTKNKTGTTSHKKEEKTNVFQHYTTYSASSQASSTELATLTSSPSITTSTIGATTSDKQITTLSSIIKLIQESSSTVENSGRKRISHISPSSLSMRTMLQTRLRSLTLAVTTAPSSVEFTTFGSNTTTQREDNRAFDIITVYLIIGSVVFEFLLLPVVCGCIYKFRYQGRLLPKNHHKKGRNGEARHCTESVYWKSTVDVYETIPKDFDFGLETCQEENDKDINEQTILYARCKKNVHEKANRALIDDYTDNVHTYETLGQFYYTLQATRQLTQPGTTPPSQRDSSNFYHTLEPQVMN